MIQLGRNEIAEMNGQDLSVKRGSAGGYVNGIWSGTSCTVTVFASVQPLGGNDLIRIAEGDRRKRRWKLYSADELFIDNDVSKVAADEVTIYGKTYEVESVEYWPEYWKAIVVEIEGETIPDPEPEEEP